MDKNDMLIMVVGKELLFGNDYFQGFRQQSEVDYESRILSNFKYEKRGPMEKDNMYKQPIAYSLIVNPTLKKIFAYQRSSQDARYGEKRLQGKWSWGIGGHIDEIDAKEKNPIHLSMLRELKEEVEMNGSVNPKVLGYLNQDTDEVGKVHFGVLYVIETDSTIVKPKDAEINTGKLMTIEELEKIHSSPECTVEEWSKLALEPLKRFLNS